MKTRRKLKRLIGERMANKIINDLIYAPSLAKVMTIHLRTPNAPNRLVKIMMGDGDVKFKIDIFKTK